MTNIRGKNKPDKGRDWVNESGRDNRIVLTLLKIIKLKNMLKNIPLASKEKSMAGTKVNSLRFKTINL